jgi:hypothetical protein
MRSKLILISLCVYLAFAVTSCNKPATDNSSDTASNDTQTSGSEGEKASGKEARERKEHERKEAKKALVTVPSGTAITINLGSSIGSKLSKPGDTFTGSIAKDVMAGNNVAIPKGTNVSGTVADAKALGRFKGGAVLQVRLDSVHIAGADVPVQAAARSFAAKGKGKRTAVLAGGGAALGGIIGAIAGGGEGAAIGMAAGGGAGAGGAAFTGNKDIVLPAESDLTFELSQPLELKQ